MTNDDVLYRSRLRLFALAEEVGSVRKACRLLGVRHSTFYRWQRVLVLHGTENLRPREQPQPRMPNSLSRWRYARFVTCQQLQVLAIVTVFALSRPPARDPTRAPIPVRACPSGCRKRVERRRPPGHRDRQRLSSSASATPSC